MELSCSCSKRACLFTHLIVAFSLKILLSKAEEECVIPIVENALFLINGEMYDVGALVRVPVEPGTMVTLICRQGFTRHLGYGASEPSSVCNTDGSWSPQIGTCEPTRKSPQEGMSCTLPIINSGQLFVNGDPYDVSGLESRDAITVLHGTVIFLGCPDGTRTVSTCRKSGKWDPPVQSSCSSALNEDLECTLPQVKGGHFLVNGEVFDERISVPVPIGTSAVLQCQDGYKQMPQDSGSVIASTCISTNTWYPPIPQCVPQAGIATTPARPREFQCILPSVQNGFFEVNGEPYTYNGNEIPLSPGTNLILKCRKDFIVEQGRARSQCRPDGTWYPAVGTCVQKQVTPPLISECPLPSVENGFLQINGKWYNKTAGLDVSDVSLSPGTKLVLTCSEGYSRLPKDHLTSVCQTNGAWYPRVAQCVPQVIRRPSIDCLLPKVPNCYIGINGELYNYTTTLEIPLSPGTTLTLKCKEGFHLVPEDGETTVCRSDGTWYPNVAKCDPQVPAEVPCTLPSVTHGYFEINNEPYNPSVVSDVPLTAGTVITLICESGYARDTQFQTASTCRSDGTWSPQIGHCLPRVEKRTTSTAMVTRPSVRECNLPHIPNGYYEINGEKYNHPADVPIPAGTVVTLGCQVGFSRRPEGRGVSTCRLDGTWYHRLGYCSPQLQKSTTVAPAPSIFECTLPLVLNGYFETGNEKIDNTAEVPMTPGTVITLKCEAGHIRMPQSRVSSTCRPDGNWYPKPPTCTPQVWPSTSGCSLPSVDHGYHEVNGERYNYTKVTDIPLPIGTVVVLRCEASYNGTQGREMFTCMPNGFWNPPLGYCSPQVQKSTTVVPPPPISECILPRIPNSYFLINSERYNYSEGSNVALPTGTTVSLQCEVGYIRLPKGQSPSTCRANGTWNPRFGYCNLEVKKRTTLVPQISECTLPYISNGYIEVNSERYNNSGNDSISLPAGTMIALGCNTGYYRPPLSQERSFCRADGTWYPRLGNCISEAKQSTTLVPQTAECTLPYIDNGYVEVNGEHYNDSEDGNITLPAGTMITLRCNTGYYLLPLNQEKVFCREDGTWHPRLGSCIPEAKQSTTLVPQIAECTLPYIDNGYIEVNGERYNYSGDGNVTLPAGTMITLGCNTGYYRPPLSQERSFCTADGTWYPGLGNCIPEPKQSTTLPPQIAECPLPYIDNGYVEVNGERYNDSEDGNIPLPAGTMIRLGCNTGYYLSPLNQEKVFCREDGTWYPRLGNCLSKAEKRTTLVPQITECTLPYIVNGYVEVNGERYNYSEDGYIPLPAGTMIRLGCNTGYYRSPLSQERSFCRADGTWYPRLGNCISEAVKSTTMAPRTLECGSPSIANGYIEVNGELYNYADVPLPAGTVITLGCEIGYNRVLGGEQISVCRLDGTWYPRLGYCIAGAQKRPSPPIPECSLPHIANSNMEINGERYNYTSDLPLPPGTIIAFKCEASFIRISEGPGISVCGLDGSWHPGLGSCSSQVQNGTTMIPQAPFTECTLPQIPHAYFEMNSERYNYSDVPIPAETVVTVKCEPGYNRMPQNQVTSTCRSDGVWYPKLPICISRVPGPPPSASQCTVPSVAHGYFEVSGGRINSARSLYPGTMITLICENGYSLSREGQGNIICGSDGSWYPQLSSCSPQVPLGTTMVLTLSRSQTQENAIVIPELPTFQCDLPYVVNGKVEIANERYNNKERLYVPLPLGTLITVRCNIGYKRIPQSQVTSTCTSLGTWYPKPPICLPDVTTAAPQYLSVTPSDCIMPSIANGYFEINNERYNQASIIAVPLPTGTVLTLRCENGFNPTPDTSACTLHGTWFPRLGSCTPGPSTSKCTLPYAPHGYFQINNERYNYSGDAGLPLSADTTITLRCPSGYDLQPQGRDTSTCRSDGAWLPRLGYCTRQVQKGTTVEPISDCDLPYIPNGYAQINGERYNYIAGIPLPAGTVIAVICEAGYNRVPGGQAAFTCRSDGTWYPSLAQCVENTTSECLLPAIENAYFLIGQERYDNTGPGAIPLPAGTAVTLRCQDGYYHVSNGRETSVCKLDGTWSSTFGLCILATTGPPGEEDECLLPKINNGHFVINGEAYNNSEAHDIPVPSGTLITLICDLGYSRTQQKPSTCRKGSTWYPPIGICVSQTAPPSSMGECLLPRVENGDILINGEAYENPTDMDIPLPAGTAIMLRCRDGYNRSPETTRLSSCRPDGSWYPRVGKCLREIVPVTPSAAPPNECILPSVPNGYFVVNGEQYNHTEGFDIPWPIGTLIKLVCEVGYTQMPIESKRISACTLVGSWYPRIGKCVEEIITPVNISGCLLPSVKGGYYLINGEPSNDTDLSEIPMPIGTLVTLKCRGSFKPKRIEISLCMEDGIWKPRLEECMGYDECLLPSVENGYFLINEEPYNYNTGEIPVPLPADTSITLRCQDGFRRFPPDDDNSTSICLSGQWNREIGYCVARAPGEIAQCLLPSVLNGHFKIDDDWYDSEGITDAPMPLDTKVTLSCYEGYTRWPLHGSETSQCNSDGLWKPQISHCIPIEQLGECDLPRIANADIRINNEPYRHSTEDVIVPLPSGTKITISCYDGYTFSSSEPKSYRMIAYCQPDSSWGPSVEGQCVFTGTFTRNECRMPTPVNGRFIINGSPNSPKYQSDDAVPVDTVIKLICDEDYRLLLPRGIDYTNSPYLGTSVCKPHGLWTPDVAQCVTDDVFAQKVSGQWILSPVNQLIIDRRLFAAAERGDVARISHLLEIGANIEAKDDESSNNYTALMHAAINDHFEAVKYLLDEAAHIDAKDGSKEFGRTALIWASYVGRCDIAKLLLERGARMEARDKRSSTALLCAARFGHVGTVKILLDRGANITARDDINNTALILAARYNHLSVVKNLLSYGVDLNAREKTYGGSALMWAAYLGHFHVAKLLLDKGASADLRAPSGIWKGRNALTMASLKNMTDLVKAWYRGPPIELLDLELWDIDSEGKYHLRVNSTQIGVALIKVAAEGKINAVGYLIDNEVSIEATDNNGYTALISAASNGQAAMVRFLLERDASPAAKDAAEYTALIWAASNGHVEIVKLLLLTSAARNAIDAREKPFGATALMWASYYGFNDIIRELLDRGGASINVRASSGGLWSGNTALMLAAKNKKEHAVDLLLSRGASRAGCFYRLCII